MDSFDNMFGDVVFGNQEDYVDLNRDSELEPLWSNIRTPEVPDATVTSTLHEQEEVIPEDVSQLIDDILAEQDDQDSTITSTDGGMDGVTVMNDPEDDIDIMEVPIIIDDMDIGISNNIEVLHEFYLPDEPTSNSSSEAMTVINEFLSSVRYPIPMYELSPMVLSPPSYDDLSLLSPTQSQTSGSNPPSPSQISLPTWENTSQVSCHTPQVPAQVSASNTTSLSHISLDISPPTTYVPININPVSLQASVGIQPLSSPTSSFQVLNIQAPQEPIPSTSSDTENYFDMRDKNNKSCKEYRQRRTNKLQEVEKEKEMLEVRNRELKVELKFQEKYVKRFKTMVLNRVKPNHQNKTTNLNELLVQAGIADLVAPNEFCPGCVTGDCSRSDCPNKR